MRITQSDRARSSLANGRRSNAGGDRRMREIVRFFITRKITTLMLFAAVLVFGCLSLARIPTALLPAAAKNRVTIAVRYPGQSPQRIERIIVMPIEEAVSAVGGITSMVAACKEGEARIHLAFAEGADMKYTTVQLRERIDPVRANFPRDADEPEIYGASADERPVLIVTLRSDTLAIDALREIAEKRYKKLFERIEGVSEVAVGGGVKREIEIAVREDRLVSHGIGFDRVMRAVQLNNVAVPAGTIGERREHALVIDGKFRTLDELRATPILATAAGSPVLLGDIASVRDYAGRREEFSRRNGAENVSLYLMQTGAANCLELSRAVRDALRAATDPRIQIDIAYDQAEFIGRAIRNLAASCVAGIALASLVLFVFFRSAREALPVMLAIPFSLLPVFSYLYFSGMTLNVLSLTGLALAAGMAVDSGIVVLDAINKRSQEARGAARNGLLSPDAMNTICLDATADVAGPIFASTVTSVCVFVPMALFGGPALGLFRDMAGAVIVALCSSFFSALTLIPLAAALAHRFDVALIINTLPFGALRRLARRVGTARPFAAVHAIALRIVARTNACRTALPQYEDLMERLLRNRVRAALSVAMILAALLFLSSFLREEHLDPLESNELSATVELAAGTSLEETARVVGNIERTIRAERAVRELSTKIEKGRADLIATLRDGTDKRRTTRDLKRRLAGTTDAFVFFQEERAGESAHELDFEIIGADVEQIREIARDLAARLSALGGSEDVVLRFKEGRPAVEIVVDSGKAMESGLSAGVIGDFVRSSFHGPVASKFVDAHEVDIRCRLQADEARVIERLPALPIITAKGAAVPLGELASFRNASAITTIWRKDRARMETLTVTLGDTDLERFVKRADAVIAAMPLPAGYRIDYGDSLANLRRSKKELLGALALAVLLVYAVVAALFESTLLPLAVLAAIPLSLIGVLAALVAGGRSLNSSVYMGMIILVGIAVNTAIVLIDALEKERRASGHIDFPAIVSVARRRIRPVAMTTLAATLGLLPLLFGGSGSSLWRSFALAVIAGLAASGVMVVYAVPIAYHAVRGGRQMSRMVSKSDAG